MTDQEMKEFLIQHPPDLMPEPKYTVYWQGGDLWADSDNGLTRWRSTDLGFRSVPIK